MQHLSTDDALVSMILHDNRQEQNVLWRMYCTDASLLQLATNNHFWQSEKTSGSSYSLYRSTHLLLLTLPQPTDPPLSTLPRLFSPVIDSVHVRIWVQ